jgi:aconitate hydratase
LPPKGFDVQDAGYQAPAEDGSHIQVAVSPSSKRLQLLYPFAAWEGTDLKGLQLLLSKQKANAPPTIFQWLAHGLRFRGHLDNISNNMLISATNCLQR